MPVCGSDHLKTLGIEVLPTRRRIVGLVVISFVCHLDCSQFATRFIYAFFSLATKMCDALLVAPGFTYSLSFNLCSRGIGSSPLSRFQSQGKDLEIDHVNVTRWLLAVPSFLLQLPTPVVCVFRPREDVQQSLIPSGPRLREVIPSSIQGQILMTFLLKLGRETPNTRVVNLVMHLTPSNTSTLFMHIISSPKDSHILVC